MQQRKEYQARIIKVLAYIEDHLGEDLSLSTLAGVAAFSEYHFHRIFTALIGESLSAYIRRLRLEVAANQLKIETGRSITEIALDLGFSSSATFARAFKERFGCSASEFRERIRAGRKDRKTVGKDRKTDRKDGQETSFEDGYGEPLNVWDNTNREGGERMDGKAEIKVEIKEMPSYTVAYVRHLGGYTQEGIGAAYETLCKWAGPRGLLTAETLGLGFSMDDPGITPPEKCRYDAAITVPEGTEVDGPVGLKTTLAGTYAVARYDGPAEGIREFYKAIFADWLPDSGYQPAEAPCLEIFRNEPAKENGRHIFDMCMPVKPL